MARHVSMDVSKRIDPFVLLAIYAFCMPLLVAFLASPRMVAAFAGTHSSSYAAWVQAFGSIAAILAVFVVASRQFAHERVLEGERRLAETQSQRQAESESERSRAIVAIALATRALRVSKERLDAARGRLPEGQPQHALRGTRTKVTLAALATLDLNAMPAALIPPLVDLRSCLEGVYKGPDYETDSPDQIVQAVFERAEDAWALLLDQAQEHCGISARDIDEAFEAYGIEATLG